MFLVIKLVVLKLKIKISDKEKKKVGNSFIDILLKFVERIRIYENFVISLESEFGLLVYEF